MNTFDRNNLYTEIFAGMDEAFNKYLQIAEPADVLMEIQKAAMDYIKQEMNMAEPKEQKIIKRYGK